MNARARSRRALLKTASALGPAAILGVGSLISSPVRAQTPLKWANLTPGFTTLLTDYMLARQLTKANGLALGKPTSYTAVSTYYNDFVAGNYDVCIGSWDTFASRYLAGVPLQYVCSVTTGNMINIVTRAQAVQKFQDLQGKTLAAPQSTGTYRMMRAIMQEIDGIDLEKVATVQNVDNPAASVTLVMANRADAGLTWEPNVSMGLERVPDMRVLYSAGVAFRRKLKLDLPYFGVAVRKEALARDPGLASRLNQAFQQSIQGITTQTEEAIKIAGAQSGTSPQVLKTAIDSRRLEFKHASMQTEEGRRSILVANEFLKRSGALPAVVDKEFFAS
ncbi:ABC transporter substrate-binding protein [Achromobacter aloeverae]|uniref:Twin-arginine translocation pathway signal protein n=1 Tax=Achromobacter aloeverae TaxID=1750518 RepID=A0A4Q1HMK3_9BURK|nr:ABC transporter substrate-binding protein [Achromobacter aloeverae]RXN91628.1 twin-arginine translocation pathway signal protein [Achromobacter aloeverae]